MQYKSIKEQNDEFISILKQNQDLMSILDYIYELQLPNFYIVADSVFQTIWNYYDGKPLNYQIKDIDIIYYDEDNLSQDSEKELEDKISNHFKELNINYELDIHNEARVHLWKKVNENQDINYYKNTEDTIDQFIATVHAIGITKKDNEIQVYAPYGLSDIFKRTIRPIKHEKNTKALYEKMINSWNKRFKNLTIIEW